MLGDHGVNKPDMQIANGNNGLSFADPRYRHGGGSRIGFSDTVPQSSPSDALVPAVSGSGGAAAGTSKTPSRFAYVNVGLDLYYGQSESLTREVSQKVPDGYRKIRQKLSRSYESSLSLDFSFLKNFDGAGDKLSKIDPAVFDRWSKEAGDLFSFSKKDFKEFVTATNDLFNEMEKTLGLSSTGLDSVAGFFTSQVDRFLNDVQKQKAYLDQNPLGEGKDLGLGLPAILDGIKKDMPSRLASYFEDMLAKNEEISNATKKDDPLLEIMRKTFKELLVTPAQKRLDKVA